MKMKDSKGLVLPELLAIIAFVAVVFALIAYVAFKDGNKRKYEVFAQNARDFATKVSNYRDEYIKFYDVIYLDDIVSDNYIKPFKNPFSGGGTCNLYESKVVTVSSNERYVTLRCGDYLIDSQAVSSGNYKVYKVSEWQEKIGASLEAESAKLYNYKKNGKLVLEDYVVEKEFIALYNKNELKNVSSMSDINLKEYNVITKTFYRTKELVRENL